MVIGAIIAAGAQAAQANAEKKKAASAGPRRHRRRVGKLGDRVQQNLGNKQRALIAMAQAHQNYAMSMNTR